MIKTRPTRQLLPLHDEHIEELSDSDEPAAINKLQVVRQLQHRKHHIAHTYVNLRRQHAHVKAQHALRWRLNQAYKAEAMEVEP